MVRRRMYRALLSGCREADLIDIGVPVVGFGDSTPVGNEGWNEFYIPLSAAASGTFGVDAGTSADNGDGIGGSLAARRVL